jgi:photosystem II stability/assembly factor-like uncharacterized protein
MNRMPLLWLILACVWCLSACHQEIKDVPLNTGPILVTDKFYDVEALTPEKAIIVGYGGKILLTTDGGKTWQTKSSGTDVALYDVHFVDPQNGWISGQDGVMLHSTDGGETWQKQESATKSAIFALSFVDQNHGWAVAQLATYLRTTDGGQTWQEGIVQASVEGVSEEASLALTEPNLYDIYFVDTNTGWMVGEFGKIYHSTDGGATWQEQQNSLLGQDGITDALNLPTFFGVRFTNTSEGIAVGLEGKIVATSDGGKTWSFTAKDLAAISTEPLYAPRLLTNGSGWIVGASGRILQLRAGEWKPVSLGLPTVAWFRSIDFADENNGWIVGGYGTILRTTDGGKSWRPSRG